jgi:hypothetical protein
MKQIFLAILAVICWHAGSAQFGIQGTISWPDGTPYDLPATVTVTLRDQNNGNILGTYGSVVSNGVFSYHYINPLIIAGLEIGVTASLEPRTRVTLLDLLSLQKHILGIEPFTNALQEYAADVNGSAGISAVDLIQMRKIILGLLTEWPDKEAITFFVRTGDEPPAVGSALSEQFTVPWVSGMQNITVNFWAVKTGDVY